MTRILIATRPTDEAVPAEQIESCRPDSGQPLDGPEGSARPAKRGRFATNLAANIGALALNLLVGLWYTPYLIRHLGVSSYGLVPLVTQLTGYLGVLTMALNSAVGRFITIELERREYREANRYFNASFFGSLFLVAVLAVPAGFVAGHVNRFISVPAGQETQASWLMAGALLVFLLYALLSPIRVATYCTNRFDLRNLVSVTARLLQVGIVVVLFAVVTPRLWQVGLAMVAASLISGAVSLRLWRKLTPMLRVSYRDFSLKAVGRLASFGGWISVDQIGTLLFIAIDLLVVNRLFGSEAGGRYAAVLQWSAVLRTLAATIGVIFGPTILYIYARRDFDGLVAYTRRAMKLMGLLLALPIGLICGFSAPLLETWLGSEFVELAPLMSLMTIHLGVNLSILPLVNIQTATNRVAVPGIVTLAMGAANLGLALLLAGPAGWGLYGVAAAGAITLTARSLMFTPAYNAYGLRQKPTGFYGPLIRVIVVTSATAFTCLGLSRFLSLAGWFRLASAAAAVSLVYIAVVLLTQVSAEERSMMWKAVRLAVQGRSHVASDSDKAEAAD